MYKEKLKVLLIQGGIGITIGIVLSLATMPDTGALCLLIGALFAGVPYGWQLSGKIFNSFFIGNLFATICILILRMVISLYGGSIAYPIVLIYTAIRTIIECKAERAAPTGE